MTLPASSHTGAPLGSKASGIKALRVVIVVLVLVAIGAVIGWGAGHWFGSGTQVEARPSTVAAAVTTQEPTSREATSSNTAANEPLAREGQASSTPHSLTAGGAAPDESAFLNGEVTIPTGCAWTERGDWRVNFIDGVANLGALPEQGRVTVRQSTVVTLDGKSYRAVDFACWGGGNLIYDMIGLYDETGLAIQTDVGIAAGPYQNNAIAPVEGSLKAIENGFHLQWGGEFLATDDACSACATGAAEADFVWNGSTFDVINKVTWQERD